MMMPDLRRILEQHLEGDFQNNSNPHHCRGGIDETCKEVEF